MTDAPQKVLFVDRDGTLIEEPPDEQVDSLAKVRWLPDVFAPLQQLVAAGYRLVMVTNQDGLGTSSFPREQFEAPQSFVVDTLASQGIRFDAICICPHRPADGCECRKPKSGMFKRISETLNVDLNGVPAIGDSLRDLQSSATVGCLPMLVRTGKGEKTRAEGLRSEGIGSGQPFRRSPLISK